MEIVRATTSITAALFAAHQSAARNERTTQKKTTQIARAATLVTAALLAAHVGAARAAPFKVYSPIVESGVTEIEYRGFRDFDRREAVDRSQTHKLGVGHGYGIWWTEIYGELEKEGGESLKIESFEWENLFQLAPQGKYWADTGVLVEYERAAHGSDPDKIVVAPLIEKELAPKLLATLNLRFGREIGSNAASGVGFEYAARLKYNYHPHFEPAVEFYGDPGRVNHFAGREEQSHWIGPALYGKAKLNPGHALVYSAALLFGTTREASDRRAVVRLEYEF